MGRLGMQTITEATLTWYKCNINRKMPVNPNAPKLIDTIQEISWLPRQNEYVFACATWEGLLRFYGLV